MLLVNLEDTKFVAKSFLLDNDLNCFGIAFKNNEEDEQYYSIVFSKEDVEEDINKLRSKKPKKKEQSDISDNSNYYELKMAFDLFDQNHELKINTEDVINAMKKMNFDVSNPTLFRIIQEFQNDDEDTITWDRFKDKITEDISDRNTDQGLNDMYNLFIDEANNQIIDFDAFKKICVDCGQNLSDDQIKHILENTTYDKENVTHEDFNKFMKYDN